MNEAKRLLIIGCGGNSQDVVDLVLDINDASPTSRYRCIGFLDDNPDLIGSTVRGLPVLGPLQSINQYRDVQAVFMVGSPSSHKERSRIFEKLDTDCAFPALIHPSAVISPSTTIGEGSVVFPHVSIGSDAYIGRHVMMLPGSVVSHHCHVGDFTCIAANVTVCGVCRIGKECYLGAGCSVRERVEVGEQSLIGMAACVLHDIPAQNSVAGNPARPLRR